MNEHASLNNTEPPEAPWFEFNKEMKQKAVEVANNKDLTEAEQILTFKSFGLSLIGPGILDRIDIQAYLEAARTAPEPKLGGQSFKLDLAERKPFFGQFIDGRKWNLLVAEPKAGKTTLILYIAARLLNGDTEVLGYDCHDPIDHICIAGPDQDREQWAFMLQDVGLGSIEDNEFKLDPRVTLWSKEDNFQLNSPGIRRIAEDCKSYLHSLILIDTYRSIINSLGINANSDQLAGPILDLQAHCASVGVSVTGLVNHHSNKSGGKGVDASSGSNALPSAHSCVLKLDREMQRHGGAWAGEKLFLESSGRNYAAASGIFTRSGQGQWKGLGDGQVERALQAYYAAQQAVVGRQQAVWDFACKRQELGGNSEFTAGDVAQFLSISRNQAHAICKTLQQKDLLQQKRGVVSLHGGRPPSVFFALSIDDLRDRFDTKNQEYTRESKRDDSTPFDTKNQEYGGLYGGDTPADSTGIPTASASPAVSEADAWIAAGVQVDRRSGNGDWQQGYVVSDTSELFKGMVKVSPIGRSNFRTQCRTIDVRPASAPIGVTARQEQNSSIPPSGF